ncbi:MAG: hypothetical protein AB7O80_03505 [Acetobacteraceae bacterium]
MRQCAAHHPSAARRSGLLWGIVAAMVVTTSPTMAEPTSVPVRAGNHPDFGRLVFDAPPHARYRLTRNDATVTLRFDAGIDLAGPAAEPRNVTHLRMSGVQAEFVIPPGASIRQMRLGNRIVIDVVDAATAPKPADRPPPTRAKGAAAPSATASPGTSCDKPAARAKTSAPTAAAVAPASDRPVAPPTASGLKTSPSRALDARPVILAAAAEVPAAPSTPTASTSASSTSASSTSVRGAHAPPISTGPTSPMAGSRTGPTAAPADSPVHPASASSSAAPPTEAGPSPHAPSPPTKHPRPAQSGSTASPQVRASSPNPPTVTPSSPPTPSSAGQAEALPLKPAPQVPVLRDPPAQSPAARAATANTAEPTPSGPVALMAHRMDSRSADEGGITLPFDRTVGAALFRRGPSAYAVFDERRPIDLTRLRADNPFAGATAHLLPGATMIRLPVPAARSVTLQLGVRGWRIATTATPPTSQIINPVFADGHVAFPIQMAHEVVTIADPDSGATLLVGTLRKPGQHVATERRTAEFLLLPTLQGILVEPLSDSVTLRTVPTGFELTGGPPGLAFSPPATMTDGMLAAARLTSRYRFPTMPADSLVRRITAQTDAAAAAPPLARSPARLLVAESMMALGMGAEAEALLQLIAEQDPREAVSPQTIGMKAVAALLAGRLAAAAPLADPRLGTTDEDALWRGVLLASRQEGSPEAAALFASTAPLILRYPPAIRDRLLPLALETMILAGQAKTAAWLLAERKDDPALGLAAAMLKQAQGDVDGALMLYDQLANGRDQLVRTRAASRAIDLRLSAGRIDAGQAADAMEKLLYAWRWDGRDLALRRRIAALRQTAGDWRGALRVLREARADFPAQNASIATEQRETFGALLHGHAADSIAPLDLVSLIEENADLLPTTPEGEQLHERLADRLLALELPKRADEVLSRLLKAAPTEASRVGYGTRLAALRLREGDPAGTLAALGQSSSLDLPPDQKARRAILAASAQARLGHMKSAIGLLTDLDTPEADEVRATILEQAKDWRGAEQALSSLTGRTIPPTGPLDDAQRRTLLRLATAAARAGDTATLANLRQKEDERIGTGPIADMFRLLTADAIRDTSDLKRAQREIGLAKALPDGLKALHPATGSP